jgi:hypothetical protein
MQSFPKKQPQSQSWKKSHGCSQCQYCLLKINDQEKRGRQASVNHPLVNAQNLYEFKMSTDRFWHGTQLALLLAQDKTYLMKQIYSLIAFFIITSSAIAQSKTVITFTAWWGDWSTASNWDLNRVPKNGDSVVIPMYKGVVVDKETKLSNIYINIFGSLTVKEKLTLEASVINLQNTGRVTAWGANRQLEVIVMNNVKKFDEKAPFIQTGPGLASSASGVSPNGFTANASLPVIFNSFFATVANNNAVITWSTSQEMNNENFEVQRSFDGSNWNVIAVVLGAGISTTWQQYSYTDKNVTAPVVYYRIRQVDMDGRSTYSTVKMIRSGAVTPTAKVYASGKTVQVEFNREIKNPVSIRIINQAGQVIAREQVQKAGYRTSVSVNNNQPGVYMVQVSDGVTVNETTKVIL